MYYIYHLYQEQITPLCQNMEQRRVKTKGKKMGKCQLIKWDGKKINLS